MCNDWLTTVWPNLRDGYKDEDIFNTDETGLFFRMMPDKTMKFKGEKCVGGKLSKERLTVLVAANMTGSEKVKLVVIGKAKQPRCFKNVKSLPVEYENNRKAWMTSALFEKIITRWDNKLIRQKKKILLLLDNCPAHPDIHNLKAIKLVFLPPNTTSVLQPMDQGVIKSLKTHFRKLQIMKILRDIDEKGTPQKLDVFEAICLISKAWDRVSQDTIANCFTHAGFKLNATENSFDEDDLLPLTDWLRLQHEADEDNLPLAQWVRNLPVDNLATLENWEHFSNVDDELETAEDVTEVEILAGSNPNLDSKLEDEIEMDETSDETIDFQPPSINHAFSAIQTIQQFFTFNQHLKEPKTDFALSHLEKVIEKNFLGNKNLQKQTKITDFLIKLN